MMSNCEYCQTPFRGERRTKKYCCDNCRQMAYLSRKGYLPGGTVNGVKKPVDVNRVKTVVKDIFYDDDVKDSNNVKGIKYTPRVKHSIFTPTRSKENADPGATQSAGDKALYSWLKEKLEEQDQVLRRQGEQIESIVKQIRHQNAKIDDALSQVSSHSESLEEMILEQRSRHDGIEKALCQLQGQIKTISLNGNLPDYCKPCTVNDFTLKPAVKYCNGIYDNAEETNNETRLRNQERKNENGVPIKNEEPGLCNEEGEQESKIEDFNNGESKKQAPESPLIDELKEARLRIAELENLLDEKVENETQERATAIIKGADDESEDVEEHEAEEKNEEPGQTEECESNDEQEENPEVETQPEPTLEVATEEPYKWMVPKLHIMIQRQIDKGERLLFQNPFKVWDIDEAKCVLWLNVRLKCLLDNLVRLSLRAPTNYETLAALTNGFIALYKSKTYKMLPEDYPYTDMIEEITEKLHEQVINFRQTEDNIVPFWMTVKRKSVIVAICNELNDFTDRVKFSELDFKPPRLTADLIKLMPEKEEAPEEKNEEQNKKDQQNKPGQMGKEEAKNAA